MLGKMLQKKTESRPVILQHLLKLASGCGKQHENSIRRKNNSFQINGMLQIKTEAVSEASLIGNTHFIFKAEMQQRGDYKQDKNIFIQLIMTSIAEKLAFWSLICLHFSKSSSCEG